MTPEDDHHERIKSAGVDTHFIRHIPCHLPPRRRFIFTDTILTGSRYGCDTARYLTLHTPYARPAYLVTVYTNDTIRRYDAHLSIRYGTMRPCGCDTNTMRPYIPARCERSIRSYIAYDLPCSRCDNDTNAMHLEAIGLTYTGTIAMCADEYFQKAS